MSSNDIVNSLSQWRPRIVKRCASGPSASLPDRIRSVTTLKALDELWDEHRQTTDPIVIKAFIRAGAEFGRRCPTLAEPLLFDIAGVQHLDSDDFTTLAVTTCDVSSRRLIDRLLDRTAGKLQYVAFYFGLLRCATEFLRPVDMILATDISRIMSDFKIPMFIPHARMLIHGFGRLAEPPLQALENIVDTCLRDSQGVPLDPSVLHELFAVLERMRGSYAKKAQQIALKIGAENSAKLVSSVYVRPVGQKEQTESDWAYTTYYIVDPYSVPLDKIDLPPPLLGGSVKWIILFLYSSVRSMIECNQNFPSGGNPLLEQKLQALKQLILSAPEHVFVFPAELELQLRCDGRDGVAEDTPTGRYVSFFESFLPRVEDVTLKPPPPETRMVFVTQNAPLRQSLESRIIGHTSSPVIVQADFTAAAPLVPPTATNTAAVAAAHAELNLLQQQANLRGGS